MIYMDGTKKTMLAGFFALMFLMCAFAPNTLAGSAADPEITDAAGDVTDTSTMDVMGLADYYDISSAWFESETETTINAVINLTALPDSAMFPVIGADYTYDFYFTIGGVEYFAECIYALSPMDFGYVYSYTLSDGTNSTNLNGSASGTLITMTLPKANISSPSPGSTITSAYVASSGGLSIIPLLLEVEYSDRAPDNGTGRPYIFGGSGPNSGMISMTLTPAAITATKGQTRSAIITVKNNGTMNDTVTFVGSFEGNVSNGCSASFQPTTLNVASNGTAYATVSFAIPANATEGTVKYNMQATSIGGALASSSVNLTITAGPPVTYGVDVTAPSGAEVKPGESHTYSFTVRNSGTADSDTYSLVATSEHSWTVEILNETNITIAKAATKTVDVKITVPSDAAEGATDALTLKATSKGNASKSDQASVVTTAKSSAGGAGGALDQANEFADGLIGGMLESAGIEDALGAYTPLIFLIILILLILLLLILLILLCCGGKKFKMHCEDNAHDVKLGYDTQYQITLEAKRGGRNGIPIMIETNDVPEGWSAVLDKTSVSPKKDEPAVVLLSVRPPADAADGAAASITVVARMEKKKKKKRSLTTISKVVLPVSRIQIANVTNIPQEAKKGDRVLTVVEIENGEDTAANGVKCTIYVNEKAIHSEIVPMAPNSKIEVKKSWVADSDENTVRVALE